MLGNTDTRSSCVVYARLGLEAGAEDQWVCEREAAKMKWRDEWFALSRDEANNNAHSGQEDIAWAREGGNLKVDSVQGERDF